MTPLDLQTDPHQAQGWHILTIWGIPIHVEPGFLLLLALYFFLNIGDGGIDFPRFVFWCFAVFISIIVHELGHAVVAKLFQCDSIRIALVMFGGYATHGPTTHGKSILICFAGPFVQLVFAMFVLVLKFTPLATLGPEGAMRILLLYFLWINFVWALFNLIPIHPMDGGQALYHILRFRLRHEKALLWVSRVSMVLCVLLGYAFFKLNLTFVCVLMFIFFMNNLQTYQALK